MYSFYHVQYEIERKACANTFDTLEVIKTSLSKTYEILRELLCDRKLLTNRQADGGENITFWLWFKRSLFPKKLDQLQAR